MIARLLFLPLVKLIYNFRVVGSDNIPKNGGVLLLGNHISWIDWLVLIVAVPRDLSFVIDKNIYEKSYLNWFLKHMNLIPISGISGKGAIKEIKKSLEDGKAVVLFPEGRISHNGQLGEFKRGFESILEGSRIPVVPFYLHGLWGSIFSRASKRYRKSSKRAFRREISVYFGNVIESDIDSFELKQQIRILWVKAWDKTVSQMESIQSQWLDRFKTSPFKRALIDMQTQRILKRVDFLTAVLIFVKHLKKIVENEKNIGVLLPSSGAAYIISMAVLMMGKRVVNLNYTLSADAMKVAVKKADINIVISSKQFLTKLSSKGFNPANLLQDKLLFAEDIASSISKREKIFRYFEALLMPKFILKRKYLSDSNIDDTATILFSSGSEGTPKGIELSHKNIIGNIKEVGVLLNYRDDDLILGSLPIFHTFGLTVSTILPLIEGIPVVTVADPTDSLLIGKACAKYKVTVMFGTSTFYRLYIMNKKLNKLMFSTIRMAVAGAEKLREDIRDGFFERFGLEIYEGYGATETSPVVSVNMPDYLDRDTLELIKGNKIKTVGEAIPGTLVKIFEPESMRELKAGEEGLIAIAGVQVMKGYLNETEKTSEVIAEIDGVRFYKTGDKGYLDKDGFITIVDRYSRFAKIGGEMISLSAVEEAISKTLSEEIELAVASVSDAKKGEKIILLYNGEVEIDILKGSIRNTLPPIMHPASIHRVPEIPKLASGKADFKAIKSLALELSDSI